MWVKIEKDVFEEGKIESLIYLYSILSWSPERTLPRYNFLINVTKIDSTENYKKLKQTYPHLDEIIQREFDANIISSDSIDATITKVKGDSCFNLEEAIPYFQQPVSIVLENNNNDSYFINAIIECFDIKDSNNVYKVKEHLKNGWIKFENAGGCDNIENFLKGFIRSFNDLSLKNDRKISDYFRGIIILDSDKRYPSQSYEKEKRIVKLNEEGYKNIHLLEKRMMENYLPDEVFLMKAKESMKSKKELIDGIYPSFVLKKEDKTWVKTYLKLNDEQKDFLNFNNGIKRDKERKENMLDENVKSLYSTILETNDFSVLERGFKLSKANFPLLFNHELVNKETLKNRCGSNELGLILKKIKDLL